MWQTLVSGVASILSYLYDFTVNIGFPSYVFAIIIFTLVIKIVLYPLSAKQLHSMKKMQELQPIMTEIQNKYKKNPDKAQKEIMELYKKHNYNPMSGCLPLLVQMPILIAMFQALRDFQYNDLGASFLWVEHLKNPDPIILPIIVAATMFLQTKTSSPAMSGNAKDGGNSTQQSMNKTMLYVMPLMIGYFSTKFPAGLSLYWIFYNIFSTLQQVLVNRQPAKIKGELSGK